MKNPTDKDFFYCYTRVMSDYLKQHGIPYLFKFRSIKDNSICTLYYKTDELQRALNLFQSTD